MAKATADIRSLARLHTAMGINVLVAVAKQSKSPPAARVAAVSELFNRGWGKAPNTYNEGELDVRVTIRHILEHIDERPVVVNGEAVRCIEADTAVVVDDKDNPG